MTQQRPHLDRIHLQVLGAPVCPGRPWTFWTEPRGTDDWWPDIVFLAAAPADPGDRVVDLDREQWPDPGYSTLANRLVFRLTYRYFPEEANGRSECEDP